MWCYLETNKVRVEYLYYSQPGRKTNFEKVYQGPVQGGDKGNRYRCGRYLRYAPGRDRRYVRLPTNTTTRTSATHLIRKMI